MELAKWLALSDEGKEFMVTQIGSTLPFDDVNVVNENPLAVSTRNTSTAGKILDISTFLCEAPSDFWLIIGPYDAGLPGAAIWTRDSGFRDRSVLPGSLRHESSWDGRGLWA